MDENSLAFLGHLSAGLAHELRNPLNTLSVNLQLLKEDWKNPQNPKEERTKRKITILLRETRRLEEILNDFLRFAGKHELKFKRCSLTTVVEEVLNFMEPEFIQNKIRLYKYYQPDLPESNIDVDLMKQALLNIILNAQEAMPGGGDLFVRITREQNVAVIEVTDTGTGIEPEIMPRIFDVYFSTKKTGSGLGLPTARRIIAEHGGTISARSEPGKGSSFRIEIPTAGTNSTHQRPDGR